MTDIDTSAVSGATPHRMQLDRRRLNRRHAAEKRFRLYGILAIAMAVVMLLGLLYAIVEKGVDAFWRTEIALDVFLDPGVIDPEGSNDPAVIAKADYQGLIKRTLRERFPTVEKRREKRRLYALLSRDAGQNLRDDVLEHPDLVGQRRTLWVAASDSVDAFVKDDSQRWLAEDSRKLRDDQVAWLDALASDGNVDQRFNWTFFTSGDSREPEQAGILGAMMGSFYTLLVTLLLSLPVGILAAIYLEEFAPKNRWTDLIEININNLAAVPSIVFGLLGLAVFLNFFGLPRSAPLVGGMVLALMTLPTIIIAARAALKAVPPSIREAALGLGASKQETIWHHVLPLAMPGILTGTIIGMAQALGETAPLLMIGMVAFIVDVPTGVTDPATALPVQIYLWADSPERGFVAKTSAAIMVLLAFLVAMNALAVFLRKKFERRW